MSAAIDETTTIKFHASLSVSDLGRSVEFYEVLFGIEPTKCRADYAKFELNEPPIVLSLIPGRPAPGGNLNHAGIRVANSEELVKIQSRLEGAGIRTQREEGVECCYSRQTKFWVTDPDRTLWEIYVFHEDIDEHGDDSVPDAQQVASFAKEVPRERIVWQHQLTDPIPARIPHDDHSVHEVALEGFCNLKLGAETRNQFLREVHRVLRPGSEVRVHGLASDAPFPGDSISLPGPAAAVQYVPAHAEPLYDLLRAGFVDARFDRISEKAYFTVSGVNMREIVLVARKPGHRPKKATHTAIYLGPLAQVTDDFGNAFRRGEPTMLNIHDWQVLSKSSVASQFVFLAPASNGKP